MTGENVVAQARQWLGVRWLHQGRSRDGVDCVGLVIKVAHELALKDGDKTDYARVASDETMMDLCRVHMTELKLDQLQAGDILVMGFANQRHMAIVSDYPHGGFAMIHANAASRKVVEHRIDDVWMARSIGAFRFPGI